MSTPSARVLSLVAYFSKLRQENYLVPRQIHALKKQLLCYIEMLVQIGDLVQFVYSTPFVRARMCYCVRVFVCACARSVVHLTYQVVSTLINSGLLCQEESTLSYK